MKTGTWNEFRTSWTMMLLLSLLFYTIGAMIYSNIVCSGVSAPHSFYGCILFLEWEPVFWPIFFIFTTMFNTVGIIIYSSLLSLGVWYFFWYYPRRKKALDRKNQGGKL